MADKTKPESELRVSVVMCSYNGEDFIREQLLSVISQTFPIYELLVFDDASTDSTVQVIEEVASLYPVVRLSINQRNLGYTKNFEQAISAASGDVIAISDQDDIWINTKIEKMMHAWKPPNPVIYCNSFIFTDTPPAKSRQPAFNQFEGVDSRKLAMVNTTSGHAMLIRKELVPLIIPFSANAMYDWWISVVAANNGGVQHYNEVLVWHRSHSKNITVNVLSEYSIAEQNNIHKKFLLKQIATFVTAPNMPRSHKQFFVKFYFLIKKSLVKRFYFPLFLFMVRNRRLIFYHKKRKIVIFSHLKHSYRQTLNLLWKSNV